MLEFLLTVAVISAAVMSFRGTRAWRATGHLPEPDAPDLPCPWCNAATDEADTVCPSCRGVFGRSPDLIG